MSMEPEQEDGRHGAMLASGARSIGINALHLVNARLITHLLRAVYLVILARVLGPDVFGLLSYGQSWYSAFLPIAGLGLAVILGIDIGRDRTRADRIISHTFTLRMIAAVLVALSSAVAGWILNPDPELRALISVFSVGLLGRSLALWAEQVFTGFEEARLVLRQYAIFRPLEVVAGIAVLLGGGGMLAIAMVHAIVWCAQGIRGVATVRRQFTRFAPGRDRRYLVHLLIRGLPVGVSAILVTWLMQGPVVLTKHLLGDGAAIAQLAVALQVLLLSSAMPMSIGMAALPVLARSIEREDGKDAGFAEAMFRVAFVVTGGASFLMMSFAPAVVTVVLGDLYGEAGELARWVLWLLLPLSVGHVSARILESRGRYILSSLSSLAGATVLTAALPFLVIEFGLSGALLAAGGGLLVWSLVALAMLTQSLRLNLSLSALRPAILIGGCTLAYAAGAQIGPTAAAFAGLISLALGMRLGGLLTPAERVQLRDLLLGVVRRH